MSERAAYWQGGRRLGPAALLAKRFDGSHAARWARQGYQPGGG